VATGIYLHIPFCRVKCPYCDFVAYRGIDDQIPAYVGALLRELASRVDTWPERPMGPGSVYFGGGTPSLLDPSDVARLLDLARDSAGLLPSAEVSLEAMPGTADRARLRAFRDAGVTRLTVGVESLEPLILAALRRGHSAGDSRRMVQDARAAGFDDLNLDLMFGLPGQDLAALERDVHAILALEPTHVSVYGLTIEPGTPWDRARRRGRLDPPGEEAQRAMYLRASDLLQSAGFLRYEVSNFARPGHESRHNLLYWTDGRWAGAGAGAHGHSPAPLPFGRRFWNLALPRKYVAAVAAGAFPEAGSEFLDARAARDEALLLGLRTRNGLERHRFAARFGFDLADVLAPALASLAERGLVEVLPSHVRLMQDAAIIADSVIEHLSAQLDRQRPAGDDSSSMADPTVHRGGAQAGPGRPGRRNAVPMESFLDRER
jgi:oxygen-independent coproporphyrinogen-3 oxidase